MASDTPNLGLNRPDAGAPDWNTPLNENFDLIDLYAGAGRFGRRMVRIIFGAGTAMHIFGDTATVTGTPTAISATATEPLLLNCASGGVSGNEAGISGGAIYRSGQGRRILFQAYVKFEETTFIRVWIGLGNQTLATQVGADDPAGRCAGFQFSTPRADTNWKCVTKDNVTQNLQDSGVAFSTSGTLFEIYFDDTNSQVLFYINGALVKALTANLPGDVNLAYVIAVETQEGVAKNIRIAYVNIFSAK